MEDLVSIAMYIHLILHGKWWHPAAEGVVEGGGHAHTLALQFLVL